MKAFILNATRIATWIPRFVFPVLMSLYMSLLMTGLITWLNTGFDAGFIARWVRAFLIAWPIAFLLVVSEWLKEHAWKVCIRQRIHLHTQHSRSHRSVLSLLYQFE